MLKIILIIFYIVIYSSNVSYAIEDKDSCVEMDQNILYCKESSCTMPYFFHENGTITYIVNEKTEDGKCHYSSVVSYNIKNEDKFIKTDCYLSSKGRSVMTQEFQSNKKGQVSVNTGLGDVLKNECSFK